MNPEMDKIVAAQIAELTANFNKPIIEGVTPTQIWPLIHFMDPFVDAGLVVPVSPIEIHNNIGNFITVKARNKPEEILGCGQLAVYRKDLAEIRSICVREDRQGQGIGRMLVDELSAMAKKKGVSHLLIVSKTPEFWEHIGFADTLYTPDFKQGVRMKEV